MSEPEKTDPAATEAPAAAPATTQTAEAPAAPPVAGAAPAEALKPGAKPQERGKDKKKSPRGAGGLPNRRTLAPIQELQNQFRLGASDIKDIDAEIEGELEAAMGGSSAKDIFSVESSKQAQQTHTGADQGRKKGKVLSIHGPDVFVDVPGGRSQGVMSLLQFTEGAPKVGDEVEFSIEGYDAANGILLLSRKWAAMQADWSTLAEGMIVEARVTATNKGGLSVEVNGLRGFMPISQIDLYRIENVEQFVNQRLTCIVTEADSVEKNLVVSRRALLEKQKAEMTEKTWAELEVGQVRTGIVRNVKPQWAFVDVDGVDGFLHISEMSWRRVQDATQILQPGQSIRVAIIKLDKESRKVSLGLKQLEESPWDKIEDKYPIGSVVPGTVSRTADFGAFVELEAGVEGLVHVSELAGKRVWRVTDVVKEGQAVNVKVLSVDPENRRLSLSLRQAIVREEPKKEEDEVEEEPETPAKPERPRNFPLRGGLGGGSLLIETGEEPKTGQ
jgi:small subunit ribosomal protein S1